MQSMEHLAGSLKRGGIKDLLAFFPPNKRDDKTLDEHFRKAGLPQIAEWWTKRQTASLKDGLVKALKEMLEHGDSHADIVAAIKTRQEEQPLPESELISCIWQGLISSIDWSARQDQNEALALREITVSPTAAMGLRARCAKTACRTSVISCSRSAMGPRPKWPSSTLYRCIATKTRVSSKHSRRSSRFVLDLVLMLACAIGF